WLPSLSRIKPGALEASHAAIDAAATDAGRDPRDIRRFVNIGGRFSARTAGPFDGSPDAWAATIAELALEHGFGTFILASDDLDTMRHFAEHVIPAVREAVADARRA